MKKYRVSYERQRPLKFFEKLSRNAYFLVLFYKNTLLSIYGKILSHRYLLEAIFVFIFRRILTVYRKSTFHFTSNRKYEFRSG